MAVKKPMRGDREKGEKGGSKREDMMERKGMKKPMAKKMGKRGY